MDFTQLHLPWIAILAAIIANIVIGMLWYSPLLFGKIWARSYNFNIKEMRPTPMHYLGAILVSAVMVIVLAVIFQMFNIADLHTALKFGFLAWLALLVTSHFSGVIWCRKPIAAFFVDISHLLVCVLVIAAILIELAHYKI